MGNHPTLYYDWYEGYANGDLYCWDAVGGARTTGAALPGHARQKAAQRPCRPYWTRTPTP